MIFRFLLVNLTLRSSYHGILATSSLLVVLAIATYIIRKRVIRIKSNIQLGKASVIDDHKNERLKNMLLVAFGQKKMFKRVIPAILHFLFMRDFSSLILRFSNL